jgi:hypothetical protein
MIAVDAKVWSVRRNTASKESSNFAQHTVYATLILAYCVRVPQNLSVSVMRQVGLSCTHLLGFAPPHFAADEVLAKSVQPQNVVYLARCTKSGHDSIKSVFLGNHTVMYSSYLINRRLLW